MRALLTSLFASVLLAGCSVEVHGGSDSSQAAGGGDATGEGGGGASSGSGDRPLLHADTLALGQDHGCALLDDETVVCWGEGELGQLGDGHSERKHFVATPQLVPGLNGVKEIAAGGATTCALFGDGTASCWGLDDRGQLGDGEAGYLHFESKPKKVKGLAHAVSLALNGLSTCAILDDATLSCWGDNPYGALGYASPTCDPDHEGPVVDGPVGVDGHACQATPKAVPGLRGVTSVAIGSAHQCVTTANGAVTCWGDNSTAETSGAVTAARNLGPTLVPGVNATALSLGDDFSCALDADGHVTCWGNYLRGRYNAPPGRVPGVDHITVLAATSGALALRDDGTVLGWGYLSDYVPPSFRHPYNARPQPLWGITGATKLVNGEESGCAGFADRTWTCFGPLFRGELGNGERHAKGIGIGKVVAP